MAKTTQEIKRFQKDVGMAVANKVHKQPMIIFITSVPCTVPHNYAAATYVGMVMWDSVRYSGCE